MGHILNLNHRLSICYMKHRLKHVPYHGVQRIVIQWSTVLFLSPSFFKKAKGDIVIAYVRLSVRPSARYAISS